MKKNISSKSSTCKRWSGSLTVLVTGIYQIPQSASTAAAGFLTVQQHVSRILAAHVLFAPFYTSPVVIVTRRWSLWHWRLCKCANDPFQDALGSCQRPTITDSLTDAKHARNLELTWTTGCEMGISCTLLQTATGDIDGWV